MQHSLDLSVSSWNANDCLLPSGILGKHHSLYRIAFSSAVWLKTQAPWFSIQVVLVLMICNSRFVSGHIIFTVLSWQANWASSIIIHIGINCCISLGNPAEESYATNAQHKHPCFQYPVFSLHFLKYNGKWKFRCWQNWKQQGCMCWHSMVDRQSRNIWKKIRRVLQSGCKGNQFTTAPYTIMFVIFKF